MKKSIFILVCLIAFFSVRASEGVTALECPPGEDDSILLPYPDDCRKFYQCVVLYDNVRIALTFDCELGLAFNFSEQSCDLVEDAKNPAPPCNYVPPAP